jgi:oligopeptide/dipeptide ABC transporter ATP-binding protein
MVFQEPMTSLNPVMRVGEQVVEVLRCHLAMTPRQARERAVELLEGVQIPEPGRRFAHYPHQLSGGQRQRVMIAMALACDPVLLLADEPTTALDVTVQADILQLIAEQQKRRGLGVVLITHDLGVVAQVADHVVVMYGGQVMEQGPAAQLLSAPGHPYTQGLLRARPSAHRPRSERLQEIPGIVAAPSRQRAGCPFAPRCASALPICAQQQPPAFELEAPRSSSCWLHDRGGGHG